MSTFNTDQIAVVLNINPQLAQALVKDQYLTDPCTREELQEFAKRYSLHVFFPPTHCVNCGNEFAKEYIKLNTGSCLCIPCGHRAIIDQEYSVIQL